jgi:ribulose-phosphate 3-epimerase
MSHVQIAPSMMCADLWRLDLALAALEAGGVDLLHFDLMDAHFVPNMPLGLGLIEQLRPHTELPFDAHLMVENCDFFVERLAELGVQQVSVHAETARHLDRTLGMIHSRGMQAGVALNPATPLTALDYVADQLDFVLIMTVNPGFAGQKLTPSALRKIGDCRAYLGQRGLETLIQVDGNVSIANIPAMVAAGADILVGGSSSVFQADQPIADNIAQTRQAIAAGLEQRHAQFA